MFTFSLHVALVIAHTILCICMDDQRIIIVCMHYNNYYLLYCILVRGGNGQEEPGISNQWPQMTPTEKTVNYPKHSFTTGTSIIC